MEETDIEGYLNTFPDDEDQSVEAAGYLEQAYGVSISPHQQSSRTPLETSVNPWNSSSPNLNGSASHPAIYTSAPSVEPGMLSINPMSPMAPMVTTLDSFLIPNISVSADSNAASDTSSMPRSSPYHSGLNSPYLNPSGACSHQQVFSSSPHDSSAFGDLEQFENLNLYLAGPMESTTTPGIRVNYVGEDVASPATSIGTSLSDLEYEALFPAAPSPIKQEDSSVLLTPGPFGNRQRSHSDSDVRRESSVSPMSVKQELTEPQSSSSYLSPSPRDMLRRSRSTSANRSSSSSQQLRSRSRSSNRDYVLELAAPSQPHKRVQKHPSAFACHLCDKKFTRAYNLRSHLRTHTDERPFVCTVCGKAFARQHDRKRHEALHSGEKKFECSGFLGDGINRWGCGRKFARADALGRHFRTAAGKQCIKPLLDEEAGELAEQNGQVFVSGEGGNPSLTLSPPPGSSAGGQQQQQPQNRLPNALLQQFPSLMSFGYDLSGSELDDEDMG